MKPMVNDVWQSFRRIPIWVQIWIVVILVPVNLWSLTYFEQPGGAAIALLAVGGMLPNVGIMAWERGLSKLMSLPHLVVWGPLIFVILFTMPNAEPKYLKFLYLLLMVDLLSLGFDVVDFRKWLRGDRSIA
ncbi:hypothetical protein [Cochlodiniinecator piscidefendens]|uniref:hypothetical protein n=1 Tax=Cochlodiniinecator piscidefendens TaxID=2715756 RepID=UPI001E36B519|nr:hypothetical protein [Cochlodiniinecator piscidefendens]